MSFLDDVTRKVKQKAVEWDVQGKAEKIAAELDKAAHEAKDKAAEYADDNRGRIRDGLDKAGAKIDERTDGKYADKVAKAKSTVTQGVDKLAEQRPGGATPPAPPTTSPTTSTGYAPGPPSGTAASSAFSTQPYTPEPYTPDPIDAPEPIDEPFPESPTGTGWPEDAPRNP